MSDRTPTTPEAVRCDWLTITQACRVAQCGVKLLYREVKARRLRAARLGGRRGPVRIHRDWLNDWMVRQSEPVEL